MNMTIGQRMKERRKELNMSADDLAKKLSKDRSTIYRYEKGDIENLPIDLLKPIADALDMTPAALMGWDQDEINAASTIQQDADAYDDSIEHKLQDFMLELSEMGFEPSEMKRIMDYAHIMKEINNGSDELHKAFIDVFTKMYKLELSIDDLNAVYTYAQMLKNNKKG